MSLTSVVLGFLLIVDVDEWDTVTFRIGVTAMSVRDIAEGVDTGSFGRDDMTTQCDTTGVTDGGVVDDTMVRMVQQKMIREYI